MHLAESPENPTSKLPTLSVGGKRPVPGDNNLPRPVPMPLGTRRGEALPGERPQSGGPIRPSSFLDSYKPNRNSFCGKWSVRGQIEEGGKKVWHTTRLGCKSWSCPYCGPRKARRIRRAIIRTATELKMNRFLTLTLDPRDCTAEDSIWYIREAWAKMRTYLKRRYKVSLPFIVILELQKSGYAHLHILLDRFIPQAWLQEAWQAVGGGRFVNIKFVDVHRIAGYLSKYLTKDLLLGGLPPGTRRYSTSRDIHLIVRRERGKWYLLKYSIDLLFDLSRRQNPDITIDENGEIAAFRVPVIGAE